MKFVKHLLFLLVLLCSTKSYAQYEYIFTNYFMAPTQLNPAMTGAYEGTYRVGGLRRNQWPVASPTYGTTSLFVDAPLLMVGKRHWIGAGFSFFNDVAKVDIPGQTLNLKQSVPALSVAFHYAIDKKYKNVLTIGIKGGSSNYSASLPDIQLTYSEISKGAVNKDWRPNELSTTFMDLSAGVMLKSKIDKKSDIVTGFSLGHLNTPDYSLRGSTTADLPLALTAHFEYNRQLNKKLSISPNFLYRQIAGSRDISLQGVAGYKLDPVKRNDLTLKGGVGFRTLGQNHLVDILLGADFKNYKFMMAYDIPNARIGGVGGTLELALHYTGRIYKPVATKDNHFCPKY
jgi:type IX secretion system PorP/SprF family membrane protein